MPAEVAREPVDAVIWLDGEPLAIRVSPGVHTPSPFTQALIAALPRVDGLDGDRRGLRRGRRDRRAAAARRGARERLGHRPGRHRGHARERPPARRPARVTPHLGSFDCIADVDADLLVTNPPQRPRSVWEQLPADARGVGAGGEDGLEQLELILASTRAPA